MKLMFSPKHQLTRHYQESHKKGRNLAFSVFPLKVNFPSFSMILSPTIINSLKHHSPRLIKTSQLQLKTTTTTNYYCAFASSPQDLFILQVNFLRYISVIICLTRICFLLSNVDICERMSHLIPFEHRARFRAQLCRAGGC